MEGFRWCEVSVGLRETIWNPLGLAFQVGERLALVSDPSRRDVFARNNQVLEMISIDLLGGIAMKGRVQIWDRCGSACLEKDFNDQVLENIGIT